jgi:hypothetical protein
MFNRIPMSGKKANCNPLIGFAQSEAFRSAIQTLATADCKISGFCRETPFQAPEGPQIPAGGKRKARSPREGSVLQQAPMGRQKTIHKSDLSPLPVLPATEFRDRNYLGTRKNTDTDMAS